MKEVVIEHLARRKGMNLRTTQIGGTGKDDNGGRGGLTDFANEKRLPRTSRLSEDHDDYMDMDMQMGDEGGDGGDAGAD